MAGKNKEYADKYAEYAMEQMRRYGIPASVTLAQGILESSNGQSELARKENNHFGIKATQSWIAEGGRYNLYSDDKPNEKFCSYDNVGDSYEHHSRFLKENSRYAECFNLRPDDYKGWTEGIAKAGYATGGNYAGTLQKIIEQNGLDKYDRQVMQEMAAQGKQFGLESNPLQEKEKAEAYSFPVERKEFLFVTSAFGMRQDPMDKEKQQMHKGLDIRCKGDAVLSSEDSGVGMSGCNDPVMEMAMTAFTSLMVLAVQIDSKNEEEQKAAVSGAMDSGKIDLKPLLPDMKSCSLTMKENGKAVLQADNGEQHISRELSSAELSRLSAVLNNSSLTDEAKRMRVTGLLNTAILSEMASQNFEQGMSEQRGQTENLKR